MVIMRVYELDNRPRAKLGALQHAAQKHLVDPVHALSTDPISVLAVSVVERKDEVRSRSDHPLRGNRGHITQPIDRCLDAFAYLWADAHMIVDDAAHSLQRYARVNGDV